MFSTAIQVGRKHSDGRQTVSTPLSGCLTKWFQQLIVMFETIVRATKVGGWFVLQAPPQPIDIFFPISYNQISKKEKGEP